MLEAIDTATLPIRRKIVEIARSQANSGAHYLTESAGARPGEADGWRRRRVELREDDDWDNLGIHAAEYRLASGGRGFLVCAGRFQRVGGMEIPPGSPLQRRVMAYLAANRGRPFAQWPSFENIGYPRKAWNQFLRRNVYVIGEDCRGKCHFDCIQFVNWVISQALTRSITYSETQWRSVGPVSRQSAPSDGSQLAPGDLLVRIGGTINHMAIVIDNQMLAEASGFGVGVIENPYRPGSYTDHLRLRNRYLRG